LDTLIIKLFGWNRTNLFGWTVTGLLIIAGVAFALVKTSGSFFDDNAPVSARLEWGILFALMGIFGLHLQTYCARIAEKLESQRKPPVVEAETFGP
jgi:hypothetical protein